MNLFLSLRMTGCVSGEKIKFVFFGLHKMHIAVLSEDDFELYHKNVKLVKRSLCSTNAIATIPSDGIWYAVLDNDGIPFHSVSGTIFRYSPLLTNEEIWNGKVAIGMSLVLNAKNTEADRSMIQYWQENQHKESTINLNNKTVVCPSCGKRVNTDILHGAHVVKVGDISGKLYITPTCDSCNTSKTNRVFKVEDVELVIAPKA